jgi:hypothetical protein
MSEIDIVLIRFGEADWYAVAQVELSVCGHALSQTEKPVPHRILGYAHAVGDDVSGEGVSHEFRELSKDWAMFTSVAAALAAFPEDRGYACWGVMSAQATYDENPATEAYHLHHRLWGGFDHGDGE